MLGVRGRAAIERSRALRKEELVRGLTWPVRGLVKSALVLGTKVEPALLAACWGTGVLAVVVTDAMVGVRALSCLVKLGGDRSVSNGKRGCRVALTERCGLGRGEFHGRVIVGGVGAEEVKC